MPRVTLGGAEPYLLMLPRAEVAAAVPVPLVVPPADSTVRLIELSTVPVTVSVPLLVAAEALSAVIAEIAATARNVFIILFLPSLMESAGGGKKYRGV